MSSETFENVYAAEPTGTDSGRVRHFWRERGFFAVVVMAALGTLFNILLIQSNPPVDGDSYEYAAVARNLLESGKMQLNHVQGHFVRDQEVPAPAWNRATLWTLAMTPAQLLFGDSFWTFAAPYQLTYFLVGPVSYAVAHALFGPTIALPTAIATLFNPRVTWWATLEDPGHPDTLAVSFFLVSLLLVARRRWVAAGVVAGITMLFRMSIIVLPPTVFIWTLLYHRSELRRPGPYLFIAAFLLFSAPHFIRTAMVFDGNPLYSDQAASKRSRGERVVKIIKEQSSLEIMFRYEQPDMAETPHTLATRAQVIFYNTRNILFGSYNEISWYPGLFEGVTFILSPFFLIGMWVTRRRREAALLSVFLCVYLATMITLKMGYEDRYLLAVIPCCAMLAFAGVRAVTNALATRLDGIKVLLLALVLVELLPSFGIKLFAFKSDESRNQYAELQQTCSYIADNIPSRHMYMTTPFWSPQYLCNQWTVPPVLGDMSEFRQAARDYEVDYLLFSQYWNGDRFPAFSFLEPVLRGRFLTLYRLDRAHPDFSDFGAHYGYLQQFEPMGHFWHGRFNVRTDPPAAIALGHASGHVVGGGILFLLACATVVLAARSGRRQRLIVYGVVAFVVFAAKLSSLAPLRERFPEQKPPASNVQANAWLQARQLPRALLVQRPGQLSDNLFYPFVDGQLEVDALSEVTAVAETTSLFFPVPLSEAWLDSPAALEQARQETIANNRRRAALARQLTDLGLNSEIVEGGVLAVR